MCKVLYCIVLADLLLVSGSGLKEITSKLKNNKFVRKLTDTR
jgi:hypothetical protein